MSSWKSILSIACFCLPLWASANTNSVKFNELSSFLRKAKEYAGMTSATSVTLINKKGIVFSEHEGFMDVENKIHADDNTMYYFASTTKAMLALAILMEEHKGTISRSSTLKSLFPSLPFHHIDPEKYTVKQLLSHTSGLSNNAMTWSFSYTGQHDEARRQGFLSQLKPSMTSAGGEFEYTNLGYNILAIWLEEKYQRPWHTVVQNTLFKPLGMLGTSGDIDKAMTNKKPIALPYSYKFEDGKSALPLRKSNNTLYSVGVYSRPKDIAQLLYSLFPANEKNSALPEEVIKASREILVDNIDSYYSAYGWGWQHGTFGSDNILFHTGGFDGASVQISYVPTKDIGVIVVHNESGLAANTLNGLITDFALSELSGERPERIEYEKALSEMKEVGLSIQNFQREHSDKIQTLKQSTKKFFPQHLSLMGEFENPDVGELTIENKGHELYFRWGNLNGPIYIDNSQNYLIELRPGKFYEITQNSEEGQMRFDLAGWSFSKKQ